MVCVFFFPFSGSIQRKEVCNNDTLELHCPPSYDISIFWADYGRLRSSKCSETQGTSCKSFQANEVIRKACQHKDRCTVNTDLHTLNAGAETCLGNFKYATVYYACFSSKLLSLPSFSFIHFLNRRKICSTFSLLLYTHNTLSVSDYTIR